jgi:predicted dehydrogenase
MLKRRNFLGQSAGICAAILSASSAESGRRLRAGFLGISHSHAFEKYRLVAKHPDFELVGVCETASAPRDRFKSLNPTYLEEPALLSQVDVVFVESAVRDHARDALAALNAGKHVHVEKPPAANLQDFQAMLTVARQRNLTLQVGYMWRFSPGVEHLKSLVRAGALGPIYLARGVMNANPASEGRKEWAEFAGGAMFEQGSHLIDTIVRLMGVPARVTSFLKNFRDGDNLKDNNLAVFEYSKGLALIQNSALQPDFSVHRTFELFGTNGTATLRPVEPPTLDLNLHRPVGDFQAGRQSLTWPFTRYQGEIAALADTILRKKEPLVSPEEDLAIHQTVLQASGML